MQIAGSSCVVCGLNISIIREGVGCAKCRVACHRACLSSLDCPRCSQPLLGGEEAHALPNAAEQTESARPTSVTVIGRLNYLGVPLGAILVLIGLFQMVGDLGLGLTTIIGGLLIALLSVAVGSGLLGGREWARRFYLWVTPVGLAVDLVTGDNNVVQAGFSRLGFAIGSGAYLVCAFLLTRPKTVAFFKDTNRRNAAP